MDKLPDAIEECHQLIRLLMNTLDDLSKRFEVIEAENKRLKIECAEFKERLNSNSLNSPLPRKSVKKKKNNRESSGKKSGSQPERKGHCRELLPSDQVDFIWDCRLPTNYSCDSIQSAGKYVRH